MVSSSSTNRLAFPPIYPSRPGHRYELALCLNFCGSARFGCYLVMEPTLFQARFASLLPTCHAWPQFFRQHRIVGRTRTLELAILDQQDAQRHQAKGQKENDDCYNDGCHGLVCSWRSSTSNSATGRFFFENRPVQRHPHPLVQSFPSTSNSATGRFLFRKWTRSTAPPSPGSVIPGNFTGLRSRSAGNEKGRGRCATPPLSISI